MKESDSQKEFADDETTPIETREDSKCESCGEEYGQPLLTENLSGRSPEEYYGCSRCLSKVGVVAEKRSPTVIEQEPPVEEEVAAEEAYNDLPNKIEVNVQASCQHELGYLKKRDRSSPIPDECLICTKMIDCM